MSLVDISIGTAVAKTESAQIVRDYIESRYCRTGVKSVYCTKASTASFFLPLHLCERWSLVHTIFWRAATEALWCWRDQGSWDSSLPGRLWILFHGTFGKSWTLRDGSWNVFGLRRHTSCKSYRHRYWVPRYQLCRPGNRSHARLSIPHHMSRSCILPLTHALNDICVNGTSTDAKTSTASAQSVRLPRLISE